MAVELSREDMRRLARLGAMRRLEDMRAEESAIRSAFPELFRSGSAPRSVEAGDAPAKGRRRNNMSASARKAVSERMKRYWAERRKAKR